MAQGGRAQAPSSVGEVVVRAIGAKRRIAFTYNGRRRVAEPQCVGRAANGNELMRGYQVGGGGTFPEALFDVAKIEDLVVLHDGFSRPGPNYKKGDSAMATIFAEL
jgi:hypothetical protein